MHETTDVSHARYRYVMRSSSERAEYWHHRQMQHVRHMVVFIMHLAGEGEAASAPGLAMACGDALHILHLQTALEFMECRQSCAEVRHQTGKDELAISLLPLSSKAT